ncbi:MAG: UDP-N-acetylmuramoyl-tripeptide--D-alanyl-D-alanine ligase [Candidatus Levybacteria bacterium]|nr:UDP-N-acetylmuramoyl-tripeptide--D-alanyl-D-alanine ligase [Candidatus Levybacteria bacterium]
MPAEEYQKNKILSAAKQKISNVNNLRVVAITGSFGKTSTKDILYTLLWKKYKVVKTPKSFNTPLGISQTILEDVKENTDIFIAEVGAYKKGEIAKIAKLIRPKIAIITAIAPQHLEKFGSIKNIAQAKFELVEGLDKTGIAVINKNFLSFLPISKTPKNTVFYGTWDSMFSASDIKVSIDGTNFTMTTPGGDVQIKMPLIGAHHVSNFLAAAGAAFELGLSASEIAQRALKLLPTPHRLEVVRKNGFTLIDNSFNTNLESSKSSFGLLDSLPGSVKIVITPGLIEMGERAKDANKEFIKLAANVANKIIIIGSKNKSYLLEGLSDIHFPKDKIELADNTKSALFTVSENIEKDALVLLENDLPDQYQ